MLKYKINTYGCQMNIHESEKIAGTLKRLGYQPIESDCDEYDIIVFNTCCIRDNAEKKVLGHIGTIKAKKEKNPSLIVVVLGCMTQQGAAPEKLVKRFPFIDIVLGTSNIHTLADKISKLLDCRSKIIDIDNNPRPNIVEFDGAYRTSGINAWVNIAYGCNNFCSYCIVPHVRGRERSRDFDKIVNEVKLLLAEGYREITLLGQNVNSYGADIAGGRDFADLLDALGNIGGKHRIRFMTSHPKDLNPKVVDIIAKYPNICNYIHLPIQSGSDNVLLAMNRKYDSKRYFQLVEMIRSKIPNCGISTDLMVGFPSESEADFQQTLDVTKKVEFSTAFTYIYSPRKGTPASEMEQLSYSIKSARIQKLIALQNDITKKLSAKYEGNIYEVLIEGVKDNGNYCGRTDCGRLVNIVSDENVVGKFCLVKVLKSQSASLYAELLSVEED